MSDTAEADETQTQTQAGEGEGQDQRLSYEELSKRYDASRRDLKDVRRASREATQQVAAMQARLDSMGAQPQTKAEKAAMPDPETDPIEFMKYARNLISDMQANDARAEEQAKADEERNQQLRSTSQRVAQYEEDFRDDHPDYDKACGHFQESLVDELKEAGLSGAELQRQLREDIVGIATRAMRAGKDPAKVMYDLAKKRGFGTKKAEETDDKKGANDNADKTFEAIARSRDQDKSLSKGGGGGSGELTYEYVNGLKGKAFLEARAKLRQQEVDREKAARRRA